VTGDVTHCSSQTARPSIIFINKIQGTLSFILSFYFSMLLLVKHMTVVKVILLSGNLSYLIKQKAERKSLVRS
jgi:hypothetical protein